MFLNSRHLLHVSSILHVFYVAYIIRCAKLNSHFLNEESSEIGGRYSVSISFFLGQANHRSNQLVEDETSIEMSLYFQCGDGEFVSVLGVCDGKRDCVSGRDEDHCENSSMFMV